MILIEKTTFAFELFKQFNHENLHAIMHHHIDLSFILGGEILATECCSSKLNQIITTPQLRSSFQVLGWSTSINKETTTTFSYSFGIAVFH